MIARCHGINTGLGYIVGGGYEGKTKELDAAVLEAAKLLQETYGRDVVIRFNSHRESGGAFIKDNKTDAMLGIGAGLSSSVYEQMPTEKRIALTHKEHRSLPLDCLSFHVVLDKSLMIESCDYDLYQRFDSVDKALDWLKKTTDMDALNTYLDKLPTIKSETEDSKLAIH